MWIQLHFKLNQVCVSRIYLHFLIAGECCRSEFDWMFDQNCHRAAVHNYTAVMSKLKASSAQQVGKNKVIQWLHLVNN